MRRRPLVLLVLLSALSALSACERHSTTRGPSQLALQPCRLPGVAAQVSCGTLQVFEDRAAKSGRKLGLHVAVVPALASSARPDPLFILAGGPGQSASDVASLLMPALDRVHRLRDIVFVDQRGTGKSVPLECDLDPPRAGLAERILATFDEARVKQCIETLSKDHDLRLYGTQLAMDDLDDVRAALGYEQINLWGASYGTRAALVYLRRHPDHVRSAILDGVAPLQLILPKDMAKDADRALKLLFQQCASDEACTRAWPELPKRFDTLLASLNDQPAKASVPDPLTGHPVDITVPREAFVRTLRALLYQPEATTLVPLTIFNASNGDFRPFAAQSDLVSGGLSRGLSVGMFFSVVCTEDVPFLDRDHVSTWGEGTFVGPGFADDILRTCKLWPKGEVPKSFREPVKSKAPVLLFSGELDPVTPPYWAEEARKTLPNSAHVVVPATGHGTLGNVCVRRLIEQFLEAGSVKGLDARCDEGSRPPFFTNFAGPPP